MCCGRAAACFASARRVSADVLSLYTQIYIYEGAQVVRQVRSVLWDPEKKFRARAVARSGNRISSSKITPRNGLLGWIMIIPYEGSKIN